MSEDLEMEALGSDGLDDDEAEEGLDGAELADAAGDVYNAVKAGDEKAFARALRAYVRMAK